MKRAVERQFAQSAGGEVDYESASLDLFPRPRVAFSGLTVRVPGAVSGRIAALYVSIAWLPLLRGKVHPTAVRIERPVLEARIAPGTTTADPFAAYRAALGPITEALARDAAGMSITIDGGEVTVAYGERRLVSLSNLEAAAEISPEAISATVSAAADTWRAAQGSVTIVPGSLAAKAQLRLSGVQATRLFDTLSPRLRFACASMRRTSRSTRRPTAETRFEVPSRARRRKLPSRVRGERSNWGRSMSRSMPAATQMRWCSRSAISGPAS